MKRLKDEITQQATGTVEVRRNCDKPSTKEYRDFGFMITIEARQRIMKAQGQSGNMLKAVKFDTKLSIPASEGIQADVYGELENVRKELGACILSMQPWEFKGGCYNYTLRSVDSYGTKFKVEDA